MVEKCAALHIILAAFQLQDVSLGHPKFSLEPFSFQFQYSSIA